MSKDVRRERFNLLTFFQISYGIPSGPGADMLEDFLSASGISSALTERALEQDRGG